MLLLTIVESEMQRVFGAGRWGIPDFFWKVGSFLTLVNTITIPLVFILLHQTLSIVWIFYALSWVFLWKEDLSDVSLKKI